MAGDDGDVDSESEGDDSVIIIDSEDDLALEISTSITRRQTFTFTVRKETTYIAGQEVMTNIYKERDYQEDWYWIFELLSAGVLLSAIILFCSY